MSGSLLPVLRVFGVAMTSLGSWLAVSGGWRLLHWRRGWGQVTGYESRTDDDGEMYYPKIKVSSENFTFVSQMGTAGRPWKKGEKLRILIRRKGEPAAEIFSLVWTFVVPAIWLVLGLFCLLAEEG